MTEYGNALYFYAKGRGIKMSEITAKERKEIHATLGKKRFDRPERLQVPMNVRVKSFSYFKSRNPKRLTA